MRGVFHFSVFIFLLGETAGNSLSEPFWSDGTSIVRFEDRADGSVVSAANWQGLPERHWAGPTMWTNRLQDWAVHDGILERAARQNAPCRTAHLVTFELTEGRGPFRLRVTVSVARGSELAGFVGFLIGAGEGGLDYRGASLVHNLPGRGGGILAVVETAQGGLAFRDMSRPETGRDYPLIPLQRTLIAAEDFPEHESLVLNLEGIPSSDTEYSIRLSAWDGATGTLLGAQEVQDIPERRLRGNIALVAHPARHDVRFQFKDFQVGGEKFAHRPERTFGPIAGTLYSLSNRTLKFAAQFVHLGEGVKFDGERLKARLEARPLPSAATDRATPEWELVDGPKVISMPDYYVLFRIEGWDSSRDWETRVVFEDADGETYTYSTTIRPDPEQKPIVSLAGFTGMGVMGRTANMEGPEPDEGEVAVGRWTPANVWFPFADAIDAIQKQDVDILFFTGDQIYEHKPSPKDPSRTPAEDYLYKWLLWHWAFRDLTSRTPAVVQPDDHDVYHGNLWGWGGRLCSTGKNWDGGYLCSPYFVNLVHRTQTGHNPDPYDPGPCENGIINYYCGFTYGGVGFAVLEDRKFKTPPKIQNPEDQILLGNRQLQFLEEWGEDWAGQKFKTVLSQTIYASMHVNFEGDLARDADTNGFPKVGRDRAVELFRRCGAIVVSGDQHLGTFARLGIQQASDAVYQFCVPAMGNIFWRWFYPNVPGEGRGPDQPEYLGEFLDPWGNYFRMIAVANPERSHLLSQKIRQRFVLPEAEAVLGKAHQDRACLGDGYGIVRFDKQNRTVTVECWPHNADPGNGGRPFPGWPMTLQFKDLDGRRPVAWLPDLRIENGPPDPVVQIVDESTGRVVKITRAGGHFFRPGVFEPETTYALRVGEPGVTTQWWEARGLTPEAEPGEITLKVNLNP